MNGLVSADGEVAMLWFKQTDTSSIVAVWNGNDDDDGGGGSRPATGEPADLAWLATAALSRLLRKNNNGTVPMLRGDVVFARIENDNNVGCLRLSEIM